MNKEQQGPRDATEGASLRVRLLGAPRITLDGEPLTGLTSAKAQGLLFYLLVTGHIHTRLALASLLWSTFPESAARGNLRKALQQLRRHLRPYVAIDRETVAVAEDADVWVDVVEFETVLEETPIAEAPLRVQRALNLYRGDFLEGFDVQRAPEFEAWWLSERSRLRELVLGSLHDLATYHAEEDDLETAIGLMRRFLGFEPWREEAHRHLMTWLARSGQRGAALAQYKTCREILADELAVEPAEETTALYQRIRDGEFDVLPPRKSLPLEVEPHTPAFLDQEAEGPSTAEKPFVGREPQLARLSESLKFALAGQRQVAFVSGEAGWGKTTLLDTFSRRAQRSHPDLIVASGTCTAYAGTGDPYLPFRDILEMLSADVEERWAAGAVTRAHALRLWDLLPRTIEALVAQGPDLIDTFIPGEPLLQRAAAHDSIDSKLLARAHTLASRRQARGQDLGVDQERIFDEWTALLKALAGDSPLLLMLDDLHWADISSIGLLFHLGRRLMGSPLLMLGTYRPEEVALGREGRAHPLTSVVDEFKRLLGDVIIHLGPGGRDAARDFVDALLDAEPNRLRDPLRQRLSRETQGHPLCTVEIVREMKARGYVLQDRDGRWIEGPTARWDALPMRVEGVIETRIDRLAPELKEILTAASVEGEAFTAEVVSKVRNIDVRQVVGALSGELARRHHLVGAGGVQQVEGRRISRYRFSHSLFQRYLYSTLDPVERVHLHEAVGNALEVLYRGRTEEIAGRLARHFQEAGLLNKAVRYRQQAGDAAVRVYANPEAVAQYSQAVRLARQINASGDELTALYTRLGWASQLNSEFGRAMTTYEEMEELARHRDDRSMELASLVPRVALHGEPTAVHDPEEGRAVGERALSMARELDDRRVEAEILWGLSLANFFANRPAEAIDCGERSLALARELGLREQTARTLNDLGGPIYLYSGRVAQAIEALQEASVLWDGLGNRRMLADSLAGLSIAHMYAGEYDRVIALSEQALQISRSSKDLWEQSKSLLAVGEAYRQRGEYDRAIKVAEESIRLGESGAFISSQTNTRARLALVYADLGVLDRAFELIEIGLKVAEGHKYTVDHPFIWGILAYLQIAAGRLAEAADTIEAAKEEPYRESWVVFHLPVLIAEVELALANGDFDRATAAADHLIDQVHHYGIRLHLPEGLYLKGKALLALGQEAAARDHLLEARAEAEAREARRILWRILEALSRLESDPSRATALRQAAREEIRTIVAHIHQDDLRASFLSSPDVRAALRPLEVE